VRLQHWASFTILLLTVSWGFWQLGLVAWARSLFCAFERALLAAVTLLRRPLAYSSRSAFVAASKPLSMVLNSLALFAAASFHCSGLALLYVVVAQSRLKMLPGLRRCHPLDQEEPRGPSS